MNQREVESVSFSRCRKLAPLKSNQIELIKAGGMLLELRPLKLEVDQIGATKEWMNERMNETEWKECPFHVFLIF